MSPETRRLVRLTAAPEDDTGAALDLLLARSARVTAGRGSRRRGTRRRSDRLRGESPTARPRGRPGTGSDEDMATDLIERTEPKADERPMREFASRRTSTTPCTSSSTGRCPTSRTA